MKKNYIFWVLALTALFSILGVADALTYSQDARIHDIGNLLFSSSVIWSMISLPITAYFLIKKVPTKITLVPIASAFMGLPFVYLTVTILPIGADVRNPIGVILNIAIAAYAVWVIMHHKEKGEV